MFERGGLNDESTANHVTWGTSEGKDALTSESSSAIYKQGNLPTEGLLARLHSPKSMVQKELGRSSGVKNQSCHAHSWQSVETVLLPEVSANFWERSLNWRVAGLNMLQGHFTNQTSISLQVPIVAPQNTACFLLLSPGPRKWLHFWKSPKAMKSQRSQAFYKWPKPLPTNGLNSTVWMPPWATQPPTLCPHRQRASLWHPPSHVLNIQSLWARS